MGAQLVIMPHVCGGQRPHFSGIASWLSKFPSVICRVASGYAALSHEVIYRRIRRGSQPEQIADREAEVHEGLSNSYFPY